MGQLVSLAANMEPPAPPPKLVLVPPMFERDNRDLTRFVKSSYPYLASRKQLARLLSDHMQPAIMGRLALSPPDETRLSVRAKLMQGTGSMALRWQPLGRYVTHTFVEAAASPNRPGASAAAVRGSYLHAASGLGAFAVLPLDKQLSGALAQLGVRYSSPLFGAGAILTPRNGHLQQLWMAARVEGVSVGVQLQPDVPPGGVPARLSAADAAGWLRACSRVALAYSPPPSASRTGPSPFTACVELAAGRTLSFSFFQHIAASRRVVNPFEEDEVVGITNYLDIGLLLVAPIGPAAAPVAVPAAGGGAGKASGGAQGGAAQQQARPPPIWEAPGANLAVAWQVNKNWLLKARVGSDSASAAVGLRLWQVVSAAATASVTYNYATGQAGYGASIIVENFGPMRYERGADDVASGRALLQRHEASAQDMANFAGRGVLVLRSQKGEPLGGSKEQQAAHERSAVAALL